MKYLATIPDQIYFSFCQLDLWLSQFRMYKVEPKEAIIYFIWLVSTVYFNKIYDIISSFMHLNKLSATIFILCFIGPLILLYFMFVYKDRFISIKAKFQNETPQDKKLRIFWTLLFVIGNFYCLFNH